MHERQGLRDLGLRMRRQVLGTEHVDQALDRASEFSRPMQEFVTEFCWGAVWSRDGLPARVRSLLNIALLTALNRQPELRLHVRGALTNGVTVDEIKETLLQAGVYCGMPAALEAFRSAEAALVEAGVELNSERSQAHDGEHRP